MPFGDLASQGQPLTIKDEGIVLNANVSSIDFIGAGVTGGVIGSAITETIPGGGGSSLGKETPTPATDGTTTVFTTVNVPKFIQLNGAIQEDGGVDYTASGGGLTQTFVNPPPAGSILRSFY